MPNGRGDVMDPRSWRNNNPGNLRGQYFGATGSSGGFATYPTMDAGWNAMSQQLDRYYSGKTTGTPLRSIYSIISTWAPAEDNNDVNAYVQRVANDLGIDPYAPLPWTPEVKEQLMSSIATHEAGKPTQYGQTPDVRMASVNTPPGTPTGDPVTGRMDAPMNSPYDPRTASAIGLPNMEAMYGALERGPMVSQPMSMTQRLASNPLLQAGLGILAANGNLGGAMVGLKTAAAAEANARRAEQERQNAELRRRQQDLYEIQNRQNLMSMYGMGAPKPVSPLDQARIREIDHRIANPEPSRPWSPTPGAIVQEDGTVAPVPDIRDPAVYEGLPEGAAVLPANRVPVPGEAKSPKASKKLAELDQALATVSNLKKQALGVGMPGDPDYQPGAFTGVGSGIGSRAMAGLVNLWNKWNQPDNSIDRSAEAYERDLQSTLAVFAKAFGDTGVLSNQDVIRILNRMPRADAYPDTESYAADAFRRLEDELNEMRRNMTAPPVMSDTLPQGGGLPPGVTVKVTKP